MIILIKNRTFVTNINPLKKTQWTSAIDTLKR